MNQNEQWDNQYKLVKEFILKKKRIPSKHKIEDHQLLNWLKYNRKRMAAGKLPEDKLEKFKALQELAAPYKKINQHYYTNGQSTIPLRKRKATTTLT